MLVFKFKHFLNMPTSKKSPPGHAQIQPACQPRAGSFDALHGGMAPPVGPSGSLPGPRMGAKRRARPGKNGNWGASDARKCSNPYVLSSLSWPPILVISGIFFFTKIDFRYFIPVLWARNCIILTTKAKITVWSLQKSQKKSKLCVIMKPKKRPKMTKNILKTTYFDF